MQTSFLCVVLLIKGKMIIAQKLKELIRGNSKEQWKQGWERKLHLEDKTTINQKMLLSIRIFIW